MLISPGALPLSKRWLNLTYRSFLEDSNFLSHTFHPHIKIAILLYLFLSESKHFDSSPSIISRMSVNGFSCAPSEAVKSWTDVLGHLCIRGAFFNLHIPIPSPTQKKQRWTYVYMQKFFWVSTLCRVDERRAARKFRKGGQAESTENYECCITVPRNFVQDCSSQKIIDLTPVERTRNFFPNLLCHGPNEHHPH